MSCSLKDNKDMLQEFGIISKFNEVIDINELQNFEENLMSSLGDSVFNNAMGNPFFFEKMPGKTKLVFNKDFFLILDQLNNIEVFKTNTLYDKFEAIADEEKDAIPEIDYLKETKEILSQTENMKELFSNSSSVMLVGTDESQLVNLIKTEDGRHFLFVDLQDLKEVTEERFNELVEYSKAEIATSEEKDSFVEQYSSIAYIEQVDSNPMISEVKKQAAINDIILSDSKIEEMKKIYAQIDSMLESNEITVTCKI